MMIQVYYSTELILKIMVSDIFCYLYSEIYSVSTFYTLFMAMWFITHVTLITNKTFMEQFENLFKHYV